MKNARLTTFVACCTLLAFLGTPTVADGALGDLLTAFPNPGDGETFGYSVAGVGGKVLAGDPRAATVYLFDSGTGALLHTVPDGGFFGFASAAVGNDFLVGAIYSNETHLLSGETGQPVKTWLGLGPENFGYSVGALGTNALVGATNENGLGEAYLFDTQTGALLTTFDDPAPGAYGCFGYCVAGVGPNVVVGAPYLGAAYLFDGQAGTLIRAFQNPKPGSGNYFGHSVATIANKVLVGAPLEDFGTAYLFDADTGALLQTIRNPNATASDYFGSRVAGVGDDLFVAAEGDDTAGTDAGAAYLFDGKTGDLLLSLFNPDPAAAQFGPSVAALGNDLIVGAGTRNSNNVVYLFEGIPEPATLALLGLGLVATVARKRRT